MLVQFSKDPLSSDSTFLHLLAVKVSSRDSVSGVKMKDSLVRSKTIDWHRITGEAYAYEQKQVDHAPVNSVFKGHLLNERSEPIPVANQVNNGWMLPVILVVLVLLGLLRQVNNKKMLSYISAFAASRFAGQLQREEYALNNRTAIGLLSIFVFVTALFMCQVIKIYQIPDHDLSIWILYGTVCTAVFGICFLKIVSIRVLAFFLKAENEAREYIFYIVLINQVIGLCLIPIVIAIGFLKISDPGFLVYSGFGVISILLIYRLLRGILIGLSKPAISRLYLFLYLCTLEFLPVLFVIRFFSTL